MGLPLPQSVCDTFDILVCKPPGFTKHSIARDGVKQAAHTEEGHKDPGPIELPSHFTRQCSSPSPASLVLCTSGKSYELPCFAREDRTRTANVCIVLTENLVHPRVTSHVKECAAAWKPEARGEQDSEDNGEKVGTMGWQILGLCEQEGHHSSQLLLCVLY